MMQTTKKTSTKQLNREAKWAVYLSLIYLIGWVVFAYFTPLKAGLIGFPLWFELSCIYLPMLFILLAYVAIKGIYQEIDLDKEAGNEP